MSILDINKIPIIKKSGDEAVEKLGLLTSPNAKLVNFRLRPHVLGVLDDITTEVRKRTAIKISRAKILELLILGCAKNGAEHVLETLHNVEQM